MKNTNPKIKCYYASAPLSEEPIILDKPITVNKRKYHGVVTVKYCIGDPWSKEGRSIVEGRFGLVQSQYVKRGDQFLPCKENHVDRVLLYPVIQVCDDTAKSLSIIDTTKGKKTVEHITGLHVKNNGTYQHSWFWVLINTIPYTNHKS
jgi:hypothetical protein